VAETPQHVAAGRVDVEVADQVEAVDGAQRRGVVELDHRQAGEAGWD